MVKITDRLEKIRGVEKCRFNFKDKRITCILKKRDKESAKIKIVKTIADLQLQNSITNFKFIESKKRRRK